MYVYTCIYHIYLLPLLQSRKYFTNALLKTELIFFVPFIPLYFYFYFQEMENISTIHFTSTKWEKLK